jgi:hypothetical protein
MAKKSGQMCCISLALNENILATPMTGPEKQISKPSILSYSRRHPLIGAREKKPKEKGKGMGRKRQ